MSESDKVGARRGSVASTRTSSHRTRSAPGSASKSELRRRTEVTAMVVAKDPSGGTVTSNRATRALSTAETDVGAGSKDTR